MDRIKKEALVFLKLWFFMFFSLLLVVIAYDLAVHGWIDLRSEAVARLIYLPVGQAAAFQVLTYPRRKKSASAGETA